MANILVVFDSSEAGATGKMGQTVAEGVRQMGGEVRVLATADASEEDLLWAHGIALGCPTHMGSISWAMKKFIDYKFGACWVKQSLAGKVGGVFNTGGSGAAGGSELALLGLLSNMAQNGMILVTHRRGTPGFKPEGMSWGPVWTAWGENFEPNEEQINAAIGFGARLTEVTKKLFDA